MQSNPLNLTFHPGNGQSGETFRIKTQSLRRSLSQMISGQLRFSPDEKPNDIEFVYVDAPVTAAEIYFNSLPYDSTSEASSTMYPDDGSRVWAYGDPYEDIHGVDYSVQYVLNVMNKQGPFDGVVGFSVGAAIAALVTRLFEKPDLVDGFVGPVQGVSREPELVRNMNSSKSKNRLMLKPNQTRPEHPIRHSYSQSVSVDSGSPAPDSNTYTTPRLKLLSCTSQELVIP